MEVKTLQTLAESSVGTSTFFGLGCQKSPDMHVLSIDGEGCKEDWIWVHLERQGK